MAHQHGEAQQGQMEDRAKDAFLWPDLSRNGRKLAEIADLRPGRSHLEIPANKPKSGLGVAWIAPRTILVSDLASGNTTYVVAMTVLAALALVGLVAGIRLPRTAAQNGHTDLTGAHGPAIAASGNGDAL